MLAVQARATRDVAEAELARLDRARAGHAASTAAAALDAPPVTAALARRAGRRSRVEQRPERAALLKRVSAAGERGRAAAAAARPTIGVAGGVDYASPNPRIFPRADAWRTSWDASVNVSWPLFDGGRARSEIAEAAALGRATEARLADFDASLAVEVRQRLREIDASRAAIDAAADAVRSAAEARRVARRAVRRRRRHQHRRARCAGRAAAGRARSHAGDRQRAPRRTRRMARALGR